MIIVFNVIILCYGSTTNLLMMKVTDHFTLLLFRTLYTPDNLLGPILFVSSKQKIISDE